MVRLPQPRAAIFDLDGTLVDTFDLVIRCYSATCRDFLGRDLSREEVIARFGITEAQMLRRDLPPDQHETAIQSFLQKYAAEHDRLVRIFDGIQEMLDELKRRNVPMAVVTGKGRDTADITLGRLGWTSTFAIVVTGDEAPQPKPAPDGLLIAARAMDVAPEDCVFVGDSPADLGAATNAGMTGAWAAWHPVYAAEIQTLAPKLILTNPKGVTALFEPVR
jgi:HAD superfamily hydrolase (TIGR01509 family)